MGFAAMRISRVSLAAVAVALAACGSSMEQRAATGGLAGAGSGAIIGGPVGAAAGAAVGAVIGAVLPEGVDQTARRGIDYVQENTYAQRDTGVARRDAGVSGSSATASGTSAPPSGSTSATGSSADRPSKDEIRRAQQALQAQGLYDARIDGIIGPKTREALRQFQAREGLEQTARLDGPTRQRLAGGAGTGSSMPQGTGPAGGGAQGGMAPGSESGSGSAGQPDGPAGGTGTDSGAMGGTTGGPAGGGATR